jgi:hypothetical protein
MEFPFLLHEWLKRQDKVSSTSLLVEKIFWDEAKIDTLKVLDKKWPEAIDFWLSRAK